MSPGLVFKIFGLEFCTLQYFLTGVVLFPLWSSNYLVLSPSSLPMHLFNDYCASTICSNLSCTSYIFLSPSSVALTFIDYHCVIIFLMKTSVMYVWWLPCYPIQFFGLCLLCGRKKITFHLLDKASYNNNRSPFLYVFFCPLSTQMYSNSSCCLSVNSFQILFLILFKPWGTIKAYSLIQ